MKSFPFKIVVFLSLVLCLHGCQKNSLNNEGVKNQTQMSQQTVKIDPSTVSMASQQMEGDQGSQNTPATLTPADTEYRTKLLAGPIKSCIEEKNTGKVFACYEQYLKSQVKINGPEVAFKDLKILYDTAPVVQSYCHPLVHSIGHAAVDKYSTLAESYKHGDSYCWSGYYHGVMEQISENIGRENLPGKLNEICAEIPGKEKYSFDYYNCVHGLGHGVMAITNNQLFESLDLCDRLAGSWEKQSCYGGVYMENVIVDNLNHFTEYLKPSDPLYPCNAVKEPYKESCYLMQTSYMLKVTQYDFKKVFGLCEKADKGFENTCYRSLGRDASGSSVSNLEKTKANCNLGKDYQQKSECFVGAVKDFISYFHSDVQGKKLCSSLDDPKMTQYCLDTATEYYKNF